MGRGVAVAMKRDYVSVCLSDDLPCSGMVKGVGFRDCIKAGVGTVRICCRFYGRCIYLLEYTIREKLEECVIDYDLIKRMERSDMSNGLE